ncbi:MAG: O-antigen ligase family protein [Azoarcus sp.]|jgi:O-antigen ligase|nr:O-antigen ligase family protein [Azoarcus sp.]
MLIPTFFLGGLLGLTSLALLFSPWPFLAPAAVVGFAGLMVLYRRPAWGMLALLALVPFEGLFKSMSVSGAKVLGAAMIAILFVQWTLGQIPAQSLRSNLWRPLCVFMVCVLLSLLFSDNKAVSLESLRELLVGMSLFGIVLLSGRDANLLMLCRLVAGGVAVTCVMSLVSVKYQFQGRAIGLQQDPNHFALLIAMSVPLAALLILRERLALKFFWAAVGVVLLIGLVKTNSRSGLAVVVLSCLLSAWLHRDKLRRIRPRHLGFVMLACAVAIPTAAILLPEDYIDRIASLSDVASGIQSNEDMSLSRRTSYLVAGSRMIAENPVFGAGPGTFPFHYAKTGYAKAFAMIYVDDTELFRRAHNTYMEIFSEMGIPAGLIFMALIYLALRNYVRARAACVARNDTDQAFAVAYFGLSMLTIALFMAFLSVPNHKFLWAFLAMSSVLQPADEPKGDAT